MRRQRTLFPTGGRSVAVGFFSATILLMAVVDSSSKSPDSFPKGSLLGRSRFVQMVRMVSVSESGRTGLEERSTNERYISVPSSFFLFEARLFAIQNVCLLSRRLAWR